VFLTAPAASQAAAEYISTPALSVWSNLVAAGRDVAGFAQDHLVWIVAGLFLLLVARRLLVPRR